MEPLMEENDNIGLASLANMLCKKATEISEHGCIDTAEQIYLEAIELNHGCSMNMLAILYDNNGFQKEMVVKYYLMAYETNEYRTSLYNLGEFYCYNRDYDNMIKYHKLSVEKFEDIDSAIALALFYDKINDQINKEKYFNFAFSQPGPSSEEVIKCYNCVEIFKIIKYAQDHAILENILVKRLLENARNNRDYNAINNKIQLFTRLNHIVECGICYETKLNINKECGHCVCVDCYLRLYKIECPFCRM
jgi:tetratricopeptide (TPR) repeat protein